MLTRNEETGGATGTQLEEVGADQKMKITAADQAAKKQDIGQSNQERTRDITEGEKMMEGVWTDYATDKTIERIHRINVRTDGEQNRTEYSRIQCTRRSHIAEYRS